MSHRLKKGIKRLNYHLREEEKEFWKTFERKPLSGFPRNAAIGVLARPFPAKQTNPRRKRMMRALSSEILVPRITPKDPAVKLAQDLQKVPLCRLINLINIKIFSTSGDLGEFISFGPPSIFAFFTFFLISSSSSFRKMVAY